MKILDRYLGKQIAVTALFAIAVLSVILVVGNVFKLLDLLINHDVPLKYILTFMLYILPFSLIFTIPWGFLTAVLLIFGRLSGENELIALRTSGLSIYRICLPLFVLAFISVGVCLWMNIDVAPRAQLAMRNQISTIATHNPLALFGSDQVIEEFPGRKIYVERKDGTKLFNILVYELNEQNEPVSVIQAKQGELETDLTNQQVLLHVMDGRYEGRDTVAPGDLTKIRQGITIKETDYSISLQKLYEKNKGRRNNSMLTLKELLSSDGAPQTDRQISAAKTELNKRFSFSFAALAFALVGVPLAITAHRRETSIGILFSFVIAFSYFFFIIIADHLRENPHAHPEMLIWLPNVIFISLGAWMFWRLGKK
jgi:lipopolysaccharide export system permease protein